MPSLSWGRGDGSWDVSRVKTFEASSREILDSSFGEDSKNRKFS